MPQPRPEQALFCYDYPLTMSLWRMMNLSQHRKEQQKKVEGGKGWLSIDNVQHNPLKNPMPPLSTETIWNILTKSFYSLFQQQAEAQSAVITVCWHDSEINWRCAI